MLRVNIFMKKKKKKQELEIFFYRLPQNVRAFFTNTFQGVELLLAEKELEFYSPY